jgi:hypothetical protein
VTRKQRQSQDKAQNKLRIARRREKVTKMATEGRTLREMQAQLRAEGFEKGTSLPILSRDVNALKETFEDRVPAAREEAYHELQALKKMVARAEELHLGDKIDKHLAIHDRLARLLGLDAATKNVNLNVTASPERLSRYEMFNQATKYIADGDEASWARLFEFARTICSPPTLTAQLLPGEEKHEEAQEESAQAAAGAKGTEDQADSGTAGTKANATAVEGSREEKPRNGNARHRPKDQGPRRGR